MPTTISSLVVFVALLTPGFVYLARTETRLPGQRYSPLRETATIVSASLLVDGFVLAVFAAVRYLCPDITPDIGSLIREPHAYFQNHYEQILLWSVLLFALATGLAATAAVPPSWSQKLVSLFSASLAESMEKRRSRNPIRPESGWVTAFHEGGSDHRVFLGLRLKDGTYLHGPLSYFSTQIAENDERSIQLERPVQIRTPSADDLVVLEANAVIVSASEIKTISVHHVPMSDLQP